MNLLHTAIIQQDIVWEHAEENLKRLDVLLSDLKSSTELLVLPEMFHSGFTMSPEKVSQSEGGVVLKWMRDRAIDLKVYLMGSVVYKSNSVFYNRLYVFEPNGDSSYYDKRHLFSIGGEGEHYVAGSKRLIVNINGWRICPLICYDLRFPVWSRNCNDYDVLVYVANWPMSRRDVWSTLLKARAIENQCYVLGVNRVGEDRLNSYSGDSVVIDAKGKYITELEAGVEAIGYSTLNLSELIAFRNKFPVLMDGDRFDFC